MITLVLADASLELVPETLHGHPAVRSYCRKYGKKASDTLLDSTYHHNAMTRLDERMRRGRPDIVHLCMLAALGSPLNLAGRLRTLVHTRDDALIEVRSDTRLARNYDRFKGLMEQLLLEGSVGGDLMLLTPDTTFSEVSSRYGIGTWLALEQGGRPLKDLEASDDTGILIGAFPSGRWRDTYERAVDSRFSIHDESLDAWIVLNRLLGHLERF